MVCATRKAGRCHQQIERYPSELNEFTLPYHRFKIGQMIAAPSSDVPPGPYLIVRVLPLAGGEPHYRLRSLVDGHERTLPETQVQSMATHPRPVQAPPPVWSTLGAP